MVKQHIQAGGQAFVLEQGMNGHLITIYDKETHTPLVWTHLIPATIEGRALHNVQNAMFAAALAYNMNIGLEDIRQGLRTFDSTFFQAPGRMNIYDEHPFRVILDYAHNPAAVRAMCALRRSLRRRWATHCRAGGAGRSSRRRYSGILPRLRPVISIISSVAAMTIVADAVHDEVAVMLKNKLLETGVSADQIEVVPDEQEATTRALELAQTGDLILVLARQHDA